MKTTKLILALFFTFFCMCNLSAQEHNMGANFNCKLKKGNYFNSEKHPCPACEANDKKEMAAKMAAEKAKNEKIWADAKANKEASEKARLANLELERNKPKTGEVVINGPRTTTSTSATNSIKTLNNYDAATGLYTNPMINNNSNNQLNSALVLNSLSNLNTGSSDLNSLAQNYAQGQQIADVATSLVSLFTPSPEEQARKEQARIEAEKKAEEYRQIMLKQKIENERKAVEDFKISFLNGFNPTDENSRVYVVINGMDNYISKKYNYDVSNMIPNWKTWMNEAINNNNKLASIVFSGKTLGFNFNKFNYDLGLPKEQGIKLLETIANSETEYVSFFGILWKSINKTIKVKNKKKGYTSKEVNINKIEFIEDDSPAFTFGFKIGDEILMINNEYVDHHFKNKIQSYKIGDKIKVTYSRDGKEFVKEVVLGSTIKDLYNVDAMLILANYYNTKEMGNNPEKALYYFTKAAENKSPIAMYALAQIYQNNVFGTKKINVKFKFKQNDAFAHEWYTKSILDTNYKGSQLKKIYNIGTDFEPKSFDELIIMYKKGIGCKKDVAMADEILKQKTAYLESIK